MIKLKVPHYYKDFVCTGTTCSDNCCRGKWGIDIDDETAQYYLNLSGEIGDKLRNHIAKSEDGYCFIQENGACAFLCDDNLCGIYKTLGPEHMGVVCTQFPRFTEYFGNVKETGIGLACEEAARIILLDDKEFSLVCEDIDETDFESEEFDSDLAELVFKLRTLYLEMAAVSYLPLKDKLAIMTVTSHKVQEFINSDDYKSCEKYINTICQLFEENELSGYAFGEILRLVSKDEADKLETHMLILSFLDHMEAYNDDWSNSMSRTKNGLKIDFTDDFLATVDYNNILKYFLFRYMAKSCFDYDIWGKMQFIIYCMTLLVDMDMVVWLENGELTWDNRMKNIHIFSRQVEYDPDMLNNLTEEFLFEPAFAVENLLKFLM